MELLEGIGGRGGVAGRDRRELCFHVNKIPPRPHRFFETAPKKIIAESALYCKIVGVAT